MRQSRRLLALVSALALVTSLAAGGGGSDDSGGGNGLEKKDMKVASLPLVDGAALYVAQKEGLFKAEGLNVKIVPVQQSIKALPALKNGEGDAIAGANYVSFLQANEQGALKLSVLAEAATL